MDEVFARVVWAAHILAYLSRKRSQHALHVDDRTFEDDEDDELESDKNVILTENGRELKMKFLDCLAEMFSREKGWHYVVVTGLRETEDRVVVDVTRNKGFPVEEAELDEVTDSQYFSLLEEFMLKQGCPEDANLIRPYFEEYTTKYCSKRIIFEIERLSDKLHCISRFEQSSPISCPQTMTEVDHFLRLFQTQGIPPEHTIFDIVKSAHSLKESLRAHSLIAEKFDKVAGDAIWRSICLIAKPVSATRFLENIAKHLPQLQNLQIYPHQSNPPTSLDRRLRVPILQACVRLKLPRLTKSIWRHLSLYNTEFVANCSKPFDVHAEIQLLQYYLNTPLHQPTISYLGCSKKSCLLCETIIQASPLQVEMRGRHGRCYPRWGISEPFQIIWKADLARLVELLVERIAEVAATKKFLFLDPVAESTMLSSINSSEVKDLELMREEIDTKARRADKLRSQLQRRNEKSPKPLVSALDSAYQFFEQYQCLICGSNLGKSCSRCRSSKYCSVDCQTADWPSHRLLCKKYTRLRPRPSDRHRLAIRFPQDKAQPHLIWVFCEELFDEGRYEYAHLDSFLGEDRPVRDHRYVRGNLPLDRLLRDTIEIVFRDTFLQDNSNPNQSLYHAVGSSGSVAHDWRGPLIVMRKTGLDSDPPLYDDIILPDYRHALDYLTSYSDETVREPEEILPQRLGSRDIFGVKVNCVGERVMHGAKPFVCVRVSPGHPIRCTLSDCEISPISRLVGLPVKARKVSSDEWLDRQDWDLPIHPESNSTACKLLMEIDLSKEGWGWAPMHWQNEIGNVLLVREDDSDLSVEDAEVLCLFCERFLQPLFEDALGAGRVQRTKEEVIELITNANMEIFRQQLKRQRDEGPAVSGEENAI